MTPTETLVITDPRKGDEIAWGQFLMRVAVRAQDGSLVTYDAFVGGVLDSRQCMIIGAWQVRTARLRDTYGATFTRK